MPVQWNKDGTYSFGLATTDVSKDHSQEGALLPRLRRPSGSMPRNPFLDVIRSRRTTRDKATGDLLMREPQNLSMLYRPGGLLYKPPA